MINKNIKQYLILAFFFVLGSQLSFGQNNFFKSIRLDANLDFSNKKRSYGVYNGEKYAKTGAYTGWDFGLYYETKSFEYGMEYFTAYNHFNASFGYRGLRIDTENENLILRFIPDVKFGYSPVLKKVYYGFGASLNIWWFSISYSKILHVKSGSSKYHGDGLNVLSIGASLKLNNKRKSDSYKDFDLVN